MTEEDRSPISETLHRVNYSEVDQMGVVYHARYLVWLDIARTEHLRRSGLSYRELEEMGFRLVVGEATLKYRRGAHYDDPVRVRCWVRDLASRRVTFGYAAEHAESNLLFLTASTALMVLDAAMAVTRLPEQVLAALTAVPDPVRL